MPKVCIGCGYERKDTDDLIPVWQCPSCGCAYNKLDKKFSNTPSRNVNNETDTTGIGLSFNKTKAIVYSSLLLILIAFFTFTLKNTFFVHSVDATQQVPEEFNAPSNTLAVDHKREVINSIVTKSANKGNRGKINIEIKEVEKRLSALTSEASKYSGGLVLAVLTSSIAIEKQTLAMLKQKESSWLYGIDLNYTVNGKEFSIPNGYTALLSDAKLEIDALNRKILASKKEAKKYVGGLVQATLLTTNATQQQSLAMLEQKRLAIEFGLPQYIGFNNVESINPRQSKSNNPTKKDFKIVSIDSKFTEKNSTWWKVAWILKINNRGSETEEFVATIEFLDSQGFVVDDDKESGLFVKPGETKTFTGYDLVTSSVARNITSTNAKVSLR